jgi:hypothetical protein
MCFNIIGNYNNFCSSLYSSSGSSAIAFNSTITINMRETNFTKIRLYAGQTVLDTNGGTYIYIFHDGLQFGDPILINSLVYHNYVDFNFVNLVFPTTGCIDKNTPSTSCCSGVIEIDTTITSIAAYAFVGCSNLTGSLTIPTSVTSIGINAFMSCYGFTGSLIIPTSVTSIGSSAFESCSSFTGSLVIPTSVTSIGSNAFRSCSSFNGSLTIPTSVASISAFTFGYCSGFTGSLIIPSSVTSIGGYAFGSCSGFTYISYYSSTSLGTNVFLNDVPPIILYPTDTPSVISTIVGNGTAGYNGDSTSSKPACVIFDSNGIMYFSEQDNHRIKKVSTLGKLFIYKYYILFLILSYFYLIFLYFYLCK